MELLGARKDVDHHLVTIINVGKRVVTHHDGKEGILNSEAIGEVEWEQIGTPCIPAAGLMRAKQWSELITISSAQFCINISAHDDMDILWQSL